METPLQVFQDFQEMHCVPSSPFISRPKPMESPMQSVPDIEKYTNRFKKMAKQPKGVQDLSRHALQCCTPRTPQKSPFFADSLLVPSNTPKVAFPTTPNAEQQVPSGYLKPVAWPQEKKLSHRKHHTILRNSGPLLSESTRCCGWSNNVMDHQEEGRLRGQQNLTVESFDLFSDESIFI